MVLCKEGIGCVGYDYEKEVREYGMGEKVLEIDKRKLGLSPKKVSPKKNLEEETVFNLAKSESHATTNLSSVEIGSITEENYEDPMLYFGEEAKDNFWNLYKSERRFKDYD